MFKDKDTQVFVLEQSNGKTFVMFVILRYMIMFPIFL